MPTENRSSNTEMVSAPFQREERYIVVKRSDLAKVPAAYRSALVDPLFHLQAHLPQRECLVIESDWPEFEPTWAAIKARVTGQPAPQPHAEPLAWMVGTAFWWTKEEAERDAAATGKTITPFGALTGSADIEQLREVIKHSDAQIMRQSMRISNQRAQLAERDALLREVLEFIDDGVGRSDAEWAVIQKARTALSASAEANAPPTPYPNRLCHIDYTTHPYRCGCLRGDDESQRIYDEHVRSAETQVKS
ncbi:hypothetical protein JIQ88_10310 [Pseudomonas sp. PCH44]|uniref:hypothetical protein n=1 Tax=Pseudomonas sp. PCH44 TaxID=2800904 RepID=UPI001BAEA1DB|nr:hypothetical protein [Pseudomonas sp. PCH44]MBS3185402.1 hypothetical protein [Pseudomonas sp. PCH44]